MSGSFMRDRRGMALLITVGVAAVLIASTLELHRMVRASVFATAVSRNQHMLTEMAASGLNVAMAMLIKDKMDSQIDSIQEDWANSEKVRELLEAVPFEEGRIEVEITDEGGKIPVNALVQPPHGQTFNEKQRLLWERLLNQLVSQNEAFEEIEPATILNSLKDWLDSEDDDAITGLTGAETGYYEALDPPYPCRNGHLRDPGDFLRIRGMTPDFYYGNGETTGLEACVTMYSAAGSKIPSIPEMSGKININTAPVAVITALLPEESQDLAGEIAAYREEKEGDTYLHDLTNPSWYREVPGFGSLDIDAELITVASDVFRIVSSAVSGTARSTATVVVQREQDPISGKWFCRILSWRAE